jgi:hypothetical protein
VVNSLASLLQPSGPDADYDADDHSDGVSGLTSASSVDLSLVLGALTVLSCVVCPRAVMREGVHHTCAGAPDQHVLDLLTAPGVRLVERIAGVLGLIAHAIGGPLQEEEEEGTQRQATDDLFQDVSTVEALLGPLLCITNVILHATESAGTAATTATTTPAAAALMPLVSAECVSVLQFAITNQAARSPGASPPLSSSPTPPPSDISVYNDPASNSSARRGGGEKSRKDEHCVSDWAVTSGAARCMLALGSQLGCWKKLLSSSTSLPSTRATTSTTTTRPGDFICGVVDVLRVNAHGICATTSRTTVAGTGGNHDSAVSNPMLTAQVWLLELLSVGLQSCEPATLRELVFAQDTRLCEALATAKQHAIDASTQSEISPSSGDNATIGQMVKSIDKLVGLLDDARLTHS